MTTTAQQDMRAEFEEWLHDDGGMFPAAYPHDHDKELAFQVWQHRQQEIDRLRGALQYCADNKHWLAAPKPKGGE